MYSSIAPLVLSVFRALAVLSVLLEAGWPAIITVVTFCNMLVFDASTLILIAKIEVLSGFLESV